MIDMLLVNRKFRFGLILLVIAIIIINATAFSLDQRKQALVLQFGDPVKVIKTPGLKFKMPFFQNVVTFDKRILDLAIQDQEVIASDQKRLIINAFAKFRITDPLKFYTTVRNIYGINARLGGIIDSSLRQIIGEVPLNELLTENRSDIMQKIQDVVTKQSEIFGIEIIDVRIVRGDLPKENSRAIFARMQTEREKEAREIRANGAEEAQKIKAEADKQRSIILAEAKKDSNIMKGIGDAEATKIYAQSYKIDPEFAYFYLSMKAYEETLKNDNTKMVLSPDSEFFEYFDNAQKIEEPKMSLSNKRFRKKRRYKRSEIKELISH